MSYAACLAHPFAPEACGAQIPDEYSFPTETVTYRQLFYVQQCQTDDPASAGTGCFVVQPNVLATIAGFYGVRGLADPVTGGNVWHRTDANPLKNAIEAGMTELADYGGFSEHGVTTQDELEEKFSSYRVVGWGVKIRPTGNVNNAQGRLICCKVPSKKEFALYTSGMDGGFKSKQYTMNGAISYSTPMNSSPHATTRDYCEYYNLPECDGSACISNGMVALPTAMEANVSELFLEGGIEIAGRHTSPDSLTWRDTDASTVIAQRANYVHSGTTYLNKQAIGQTGMQVSILGADDIVDTFGTYVSEEYLSQGGWSALCVRGSGLNPTTGDFCDVEVVFHVEGVPRLRSGALKMSTTKMPPVNPPMVEIARAYAHSQPMFKKIKKAASGVSGLYQKLDSISQHLGLGSAQSVLQRVATSGLTLL